MPYFWGKRYIMMGNKITILALLLSSFFGIAQENNKVEAPFENPKLVVGITIDQMRYDYLTRFWDRYSNDGFKRMLREGYNCKNNHYNFVPTYTGPGHASIFTGSTPSVHGIIGNDFFDASLGEMVYCAGDASVKTVGSESTAGQMSPHRMKTTSVADQSRLHTQMKGKTIGIAIKDRGAILPAGHTANAAYWFHGQDEGVWISSTYYMNELPKWVQKFNKKHTVDQYLKDWNTLYDIESYVASGADDSPFEGFPAGKKAPTFPYNLQALKKDNGGYDVLKGTAYGINLTTDFALAAIEEEALGVDDYTDFLTLSYSSTDYVGHQFGVNSVEVEDTYLRLDLELARLFKALDEQVGKNNYTVFLTADHGAVHVPAYLQSVKIPAAYVNTKKQQEKFVAFLTNSYGTIKIVKKLSNNQIFLDHDLIKEKKLDLAKVQQEIANELLSYDDVMNTYTGLQMGQAEYSTGIASLLQNGYHPKRSGDVLVLYDPSAIRYPETGSTHGSGFSYDTHVPLLFFGKGINQGSTSAHTNITDIAPTIAALLGIAFPNGITGAPIPMVID
jgi:predicted AlkP superfamily pyrophosphatase or phosphodiesterase